MTALTRRYVIAGASHRSDAHSRPAAGCRVRRPADPVAALRAFYAKPERASVIPFLTRACAASTPSSRRARAAPTRSCRGLDFAFACGCQDSDDNYHTRNVYRVVSQDERRAKVAVTVKVFASETATKTITFDLARENGRWLIDDVAGNGEQPWVLSQLLQMRE